MLILERAPRQALIIGGEVRVEVARTRPPRVWLRITRLRHLPPAVERSSGGAETESIPFGDCTITKASGESLTILGATMHVSVPRRKVVLLRIDAPGGVGVFPEEAWDDLVGG